MSPLVLVVAVFVAAQAGLLLLTGHRAWTLARWFRLGRRGDEAAVGETPPATPESLPPITVQLPVYNERRVVERLIAAAGRLDYPRDRFEIQVLDDSTDDTRERVDRAVARLRAAGVDVRVLRRGHRRGFKAGALAAGLAESRGDWVAIFDADFVPEPDFLRRLATHFADPSVGMVQARWGHLNRDASPLTATQALMLDAHFRVDQRVRCEGGLFFSFNGTAGAWRRTCIEDSGGWSHDTLTEDLDLSYRAQLRGWRFVYDGTIEARAELPPEMQAFQAQQRRWTKGSIQTARKILPQIWCRPLPLAQRLEATAHLLGNAGYLFLLVIATLIGPLLFLLPVAPRRWAIAAESITLAFGLVPVLADLAAGQRGLGRPLPRVARDLLATLVLGAGLAFGNGRAALQGLGGRPGEWERTPKVGSGAEAAIGARYRADGRGGAVERGLAAYFVLLFAAAAAEHRFQSLPFLALLVGGFAWVGLPPRTDRGAEPLEPSA